MSEIDHEYTHTPICPNCGYSYQDGWEIINQASDYVELTCGRCEQAYLARAIVSVDWCTKKKDNKENGDE